MPKLKKIDVGDDRFQCVKINGDQLNKFNNLDNEKNKLNKVKNLFKDADDDDRGVNYYYRKVLGSGLDKPNNTQLLKVEPDTKVDEIYDQIKAIGGGIKKPDEGVELVKVVGDVDPNEINRHLLEKKALCDGLKKDNTPKTLTHTSKVLGGSLKKNGEPYDDGKVESVTVINDPDNKTNKNRTLNDVFRKLDDDNNKKEKDDSVYYVTKTLGKLLNKDEPKATQVNKINGDTNIKDVYNKVRGDMNLQHILMKIY